LRHRDRVGVSAERWLTIWSPPGAEFHNLRVMQARRTRKDYERWLAGLLVATLLDA
jgi:hypothetical protein